jgi:hypothetical protein
MAHSKKQLMIIEALDKNVQLCREFMNDWLLFNQILSAYPSPGVNKAQLENQFLKIKSKLAREHQVLRDSLRTDYKIDGNTMNIVSGATNLESIYSQSEVAVKKLQNEWHRAFITINETLGGLEERKARADAGEKVFVEAIHGSMGGGGGGMSPKARNNMIALLIILALFGVMFGVPMIRETIVGSFQDLFG